VGEILRAGIQNSESRIQNPEFRRQEAVSHGALSGIRVLDVADESGTYCGKLLGDMGADVIKVEPPGGDPTRNIGPFFQGRADPNRSLFFWHYNTSKRSIELDLDEPEDGAAFMRLVERVDVVLTTGTWKSLQNRGLDYETLAARNPRVIVVAISGFGLNGQRAEWKSCDTVAQALGGMLFVNGHPDEAPLRALGLQAYHSGSAHAATGVVLALLERERSGRGQQVEVSLQECVAATVEHVSGLFHQDGQIESRRGTLHWSRDFRIARCRDGHVLHCSLGDWTSLIEWVKADGKAQDLTNPEWDDFEYRRQNCERLFDVLDEWVRGYTTDNLVAGAQLRRLPYAQVLPIEAVPQNPQLQERGFFTEVHHEEIDRSLTYTGAPYVFETTPWQIAHRPPLVGEHTTEVLAPISDRETSGQPSVPIGQTPPSVPSWQGGKVDRSIGFLRELPQRSSTQRVLEGVRVLDFTWVVAGPAATRILADHGADVIKIERRDTLDAGNRRDGLTGNLNRGKRSVVVNMNDPRGVELVRRLVRKSDVVIDNFSTRVMKNWGLAYPSLKLLTPEVIAISMSGFGQTGPYRDYVSYGPTLQALAGYTLAMRHPDGEPAGWGFSYSDMAAGQSAALAVLIALWHRRRTGKGQFIDLSQLESVVAVIGPAILDVLVNDAAQAPLGNHSPERPAAPHGVYRCRDLPKEGPAADRWCAICVFSEDEWSSFVEVIGQPAWAAEPRFATFRNRLANHDELDVLVEEWTRKLSAEEVMARLQSAGVPAGLVANARDLCERDPHLRQRGYWVDLETAEGEQVHLDGVPTRLSRTPGRVASPGPLLGEQTSEVLCEVLGMERAEVEQLRNDDVIA